MADLYYSGTLKDVKKINEPNLRVYRLTLDTEIGKTEKIDIPLGAIAEFGASMLENPGTLNKTISIKFDTYGLSECRIGNVDIIKRDMLGHPTGPS